MTVEANRVIAHRFFDDVFNRGDLKVVDEIFAPDYVGHSSANFGTPIEGPKGIKKFVTMYRTAFPDIHFEFDEILTARNRVVVRWTTRGTHTAPLKGLAPTGRQIEIAGIGIAHIVNGQIRISRSEVNMLSMLQQLGAIPELG